jgi:hypothetical protein
MDREQDDIVNRLRGLLDVAYDHLFGLGYEVDGPTLRQIATGTTSAAPNAATREAMEEARALPTSDKVQIQPMADQPDVIAWCARCQSRHELGPCSTPDQQSGHWFVEEARDGGWVRSAVSHMWSNERDAKKQLHELRVRHGRDKPGRIFRLAFSAAADPTPAADDEPPTCKWCGQAFYSEGDTCSICKADQQPAAQPDACRHGETSCVCPLCDAAVVAAHQPSDALRMATFFHDTYERLAPSFGYETRQDTRRFDPDSANGRLMQAVCAEWLRAAVQQPAAHYPVEWGPSDARQLTCACGNPDPAHADQQGTAPDENTRAGRWAVDAATWKEGKR